MADAQTIINYMAQRIAQLEVEKAILLAEREEALGEFSPYDEQTQTVEENTNE
jgi:hypothetical protein